MVSRARGHVGYETKVLYHPAIAEAILQKLTHPSFITPTHKHMSSNTTLTLDPPAPRVDRRTALRGGLIAASTAAILGATASAADAKAENPELEKVRALL